MFTIHLSNLRFFAHHGMHEEETIVGNDFEVSVDVEFEVPQKITSLHQTINYVDTYEVIKKIFMHPARLLETLAGDICDALYATDDRISKINITIYKLNPPIPNFTGNVGISFSKLF